MIETHKLIRKLRDSGFDERHAEGLSEALRNLEIGQDRVSRRDLELVRQEVRDLEFRVDARFQSIKHDLVAIKLLLAGIAGGVAALVVRLLF
jgi:hypothetical protein